MMNTTASVQTPQTVPVLPDDSDRASSLVGYNINNYVFGNDSFNKTGQNPQNAACSGSPVTNPITNKKGNNSLLGVLALGVLGIGAYAAVKKGGGTSFKLPDFSEIKTKVTDLFKKFRKP